MKLFILFLMIHASSYLHCQNDCILMKKILSNKQVSNYLHSNLKNRSVLYILENKWCNSDLDIKGLKIIVIKDVQIKKRMNYIAIKSVKEISGNKIISIDYPIEGAFFTIYFNATNIQKVEIIER